MIGEEIYVPNIAGIELGLVDVVFKGQLPRVRIAGQDCAHGLFSEDNVDFKTSVDGCLESPGECHEGNGGGI